MRIIFQVMLMMLALAAVAPHARAAVAAEVVEQIGKQLARTLGREAVEFGGERATRELAERLIREGGEDAANALTRIARTGDASTIRALRNADGQVLRHLKNVPDDELVRAVGTLSRPGVAESISALGDDALRAAALRAEVRLPGAGTALVREFGEDGLAAAGRLTDNQANQLLKAEPVSVVRKLAPQSRRALLDTLASNPQAQARIIESTGRTANIGLAVVAGGVVLWHATDVALAPTEEIVTQPDGTVIRTTRSVGAEATSMVPQTAERLVPVFVWVGTAAVAAITLLAAVALLLHHRRARRVSRT